MTPVCLQSCLSAVGRWYDGSAVGGAKKGKRLWFVYLRCIPTVAQAAEKEMERRGREGGGSEKNDATAVLGGCRLGKDGGGLHVCACGVGGVGGGAQSAVSDVGFTAPNPSGALLLFTTVPNTPKWWLVTAPSLPPPRLHGRGCPLTVSSAMKNRKERFWWVEIGMQWENELRERESERGRDACWLSSAADADRRQREEAAATAAHDKHTQVRAHTRRGEERRCHRHTPGSGEDGEDGRRKRRRWQAPPWCLSTAAHRRKQTKHLAHNLWAS